MDQSNFAASPPLPRAVRNCGAERGLIAYSALIYDSNHSRMRPLGAKIRSVFILPPNIGETTNFWGVKCLFPFFIGFFFIIIIVIFFPRRSSEGGEETPRAGFGLKIFF